jgi:hypothetical protein
MYAVKLSQRELLALQSVFNMAIENSCSCDTECDGKGYLGHDAGCWVTLSKKNLSIVEAVLERAATSPQSPKGGN